MSKTKGSQVRCAGGARFGRTVHACRSDRLKTWHETLDQATEWHYSVPLRIRCRNSGELRYEQASGATRVIMLAFWRIWLKQRSIRDVRMRRSAGRQWALAAEELEWRVMLSVNVLNFHNDIASTGANTDESALTPVDVVPNSRFGKLFTTNVD